MNILKIIKEEVDSFDWIRDIKTNDTIAKEIYNKLNWLKRHNVTTDYVTSPWNKDFPFAVRDRASAGYNDKEFIRQALITPSSFHKGFKDYVRENYGIFYMSDIKEVFYKIKELMGDKVRGTITESEELKWIKDVKPTFGELWDQNLIQPGDVLVLSGELEGRKGEIKVVDDFKIRVTKVEGQDGYNFLRNSKFIPMDVKYEDFLGMSSEAYVAGMDTYFTKADRDMVVLKHEKKEGNLTESNDFDWIKNTEPRKSDLDFRVGDVFWVGEDKDNPRFIIEIVSVKGNDVQYEILEIGPYEINNTDEEVGEFYDIGYDEVVDLVNEGYWNWYKKVDEPISESEDLNWIQDVKSDDSVRFDEDKLYYFNPPLTRHEVLDLMERIPNEIRYAPVKRWFDNVFLGERPHNYITYFSINSDNLDDSFNVGGWCDETRWAHAREEYYEDYEPINGRDKFFGHYRIMEGTKDFGWVDEIPQYDFYNGKYYIDISGLDEDEACEVQKVILDMGINWRESKKKLQKKFCDSYTTKGYIIQNATLYRTPRTFEEYEEMIGLNKYGMVYVDGRSDLLG